MTLWCFLFIQSGELADNISKMIASQLSNKVDISEVQVATSTCIFRRLFLVLSNVHLCMWWVNFSFSSLMRCKYLQDEFSAVITKSLITMVHGLETKFDVEMAAMTRVPWGTLESVGDQSEYFSLSIFICHVFVSHCCILFSDWMKLLQCLFQIC